MHINMRFGMSTLSHCCGGKRLLQFKHCKHLSRVAPTSNITSSPILEEDEKDASENADSTIYFKNVSLVKPKNLQKFFHDDFKLKFVESHKGTEAGIELLRNIAANYDYWIVRNNQTLLLYYRASLMLQRISYLKTVGLTPLQKLRQIQKSPPTLLFSFTDCSYEAKMVYLRGLVPMPESDFIHLFYPVTQKITLSKSDIEQRLDTIGAGLDIKQAAIIRELLNLPCFFMEPSLMKSINHLFIHKYSMPFQYDIDKHSISVLPPICNLRSLQLSATQHLSNKATNAVISVLPTYNLKDVIDYNYPAANGKGNPECLSTFLVKAEKEEEKDRTGGQPLKGRRGFNVPPRQY